MPKKPVKKAAVSPEPPKPAPKPQPKEEPKRVVFRIFECIVHLEQAADHLNKVGIFPGPTDDESGNEGFRIKKTQALELIDGLRRQYVGVWNEYQREAGR